MVTSYLRPCRTGRRSTPGLRLAVCSGRAPKALCGATAEEAGRVAGRKAVVEADHDEVAIEQDHK